MSSPGTVARGNKSTYVMPISRLIIDKLGVKLYDRVSAVLAELVANAYDADATKVLIEAPMGDLLATKSQGKVLDRGYEIKVTDNGIGMTPNEVQKFYLPVGSERRADQERGPESRRFKRKVMGRKGVGKLAPLGICEKIEIISSGGQEEDGIDADGKHAKGYRTAHLILDRKEMVKETGDNYKPTVGALDGIVRSESGTTITLSEFDKRRVPVIEGLARQLAQRFGIQAEDWSIRLRDNLKSKNTLGSDCEVGDFEIITMPGTKITFPEPKPGELTSGMKEDGYPLDIVGGFELDGTKYPVSGWVAYSKDPYKDDLMAGVRIYCNKKIAAQTHLFNQKAGFHGEHSVRSYLVGMLYADWLDAEEDLIQTDRRDILWSSELGEALECWGRSVVKRIGTMSRDPMRKKSWEIFREKSDIENKVESAFPREDQQPIRTEALEFAKLFGRTIRQGELDDPRVVEDATQLSLSFAPHIVLDKGLREAADPGESALSVVAGILRTARVAELSSFGQIAEKRVKVIAKVEELAEEAEDNESVFQRLITEAPWLIDPRWSPIIANQPFTTLKRKLEKFLQRELGEEINLTEFDHPTKRPDFLLIDADRGLEIVEIKKPGKAFDNKDWDRLVRYVMAMRKFYNDSANAEFTQRYPTWKITLVADDVNIADDNKQLAYEGIERKGELTRTNWSAFLTRTRLMHQEFLDEAERQRRDTPIQPEPIVNAALDSGDSQ